MNSLRRLAHRAHSCLRSATARKLALPAAFGLLALVDAAHAQQRWFNDQAKAEITASTPAREKAYLIDVRSRVVMPKLDTPITFVNGRIDVYLQFDAPLTGARRGEITRMGVRFFDAIASSTYLVRLRTDALAKVRALEGLRGIEPVLPNDKLTAALYYGRVRESTLDFDGLWALQVRFYDDVQLDHALMVLDGLGAFVPDRTRMLVNNVLYASVRPSSIAALTRDPAVRELDQVPAPAKDDNTTAAAISNVDDVQNAPFNLDGTGVILGEWDGGQVRTNHPDLAPRVTLAESSSNNDHSTHVAGTMISSGVNNANARGMASNATLFSYDNGGAVSTEHFDGANPAGNAIRIANNSWSRPAGWECGSGTCMDTGNNGDFGAYDGETASFDTVVRARGMIICKSAGNAGGECDPNPPFDCDGVLGSDGFNYDNIELWGAAKNIITVGNLLDNATGINSSSSHGPVDDGRIKPDVCANGTTLFSTWALGVTINACIGADYCSISGTSMSTPTVSGICALLEQRYRQIYGGINPSPDIIKALLCNTATDLGRPGPDYQFGHGLVDALAAVQTIDVGPVRIITDAVDAGQTDEWLLAVPANTPELRVALNWLDPAGVANDGANDIVNDLDLTLISPSNQVFFPFTGPGFAFTNDATSSGPNSVDTLEQRRIPNPQQGFWRVRVAGTAVPFGPQNYALVANTSFALADQPNITVNAALDFDELCDGEFQDKVVSIFNTGGAALLVHQVTMTDVSGGAFTLHADPQQPFLVQPGAHVDVTVHFDPNGPGLHAGVLTIFSNDIDQPIYTVAATGEGCPPPDIAVSGSLDFGTVCAGTLAEKTIQVCNIGVDDLIVTSLDFFQCSDFKVVNNIFPATVLGGHCLPVTIRYTPTGAGDHACFLAILSNDPDEPLVTLLATGSTPTNSLDVPLPACFPPTVIQSVSASCKSEQPYSITNTGACPVLIKSVTITPPGPHASDFTIVGLPSLPVTLQPGAVLGGGVLKLVFKPTNVERYVTGTLNVTYQSDSPTLGSLTTISQPLAGEGVKTGARLLVNHLGAFVPLLDRVTLYKVNSMTPLDLQFVDQQNNVPVKFDPGTGNCLGFLFHREWGGVTNPIKLEPGDYLIEIGVHINAVPYLLKQDFTVGVCDFIPDLVIDF